MVSGLRAAQFRGVRRDVCPARTSRLRSAHLHAAEEARVSLVRAELLLGGGGLLQQAHKLLWPQLRLALPPLRAGVIEVVADAPPGILWGGKALLQLPDRVLAGGLNLLLVRQAAAEVACLVKRAQGELVLVLRVRDLAC